MNAVKIGEVRGEEFEAWYFHDRVSLLIGNKYTYEFAQKYGISGSVETVRDLNNKSDSELNKIGEAIIEYVDYENLEESITSYLKSIGYTDKQISNIINK